MVVLNVDVFEPLVAINKIDVSENRIQVVESQNLYAVCYEKTVTCDKGECNNVYMNTIQQMAQNIDEWDISYIPQGDRWD